MLTSTIGNTKILTHIQKFRHTAVFAPFLLELESLNHADVGQNPKAKVKQAEIC